MQLDPEVALPLLLSAPPPFEPPPMRTGAPPPPQSARVPAPPSSSSSQSAAAPPLPARPQTAPHQRATRGAGGSSSRAVADVRRHRATALSGALSVSLGVATNGAAAATLEVSAQRPGLGQLAAPFRVSPRLHATALSLPVSLHASQTGFNFAP